MTTKMTTNETIDIKIEIRDVQGMLASSGVSYQKAVETLCGVEKEIAKYSAAVPEDPRPRIQQEREDFQAGLLVGTATLAELASFERNAEKKCKEHDRLVRESKTPGHILDAQAGLRRKIQTLDAEIERLRATDLDLCRQHLLAEAEEAGRAYAAAGHEAFKAMCRIVALGSLHKRAGGENFIGQAMDAFCLPGLGVSTARTPMAGPIARGSLHSLETAADYRFLDEAEAEIFEQLRQEGITLPLPSPAATPTPVEARPPEPTTAGVASAPPAASPVSRPAPPPDPEDEPAAGQVIRSKVWTAADHPEDSSIVRALNEDGIERDALGRPTHAVTEPDDDGAA